MSVRRLPFFDQDSDLTLREAVKVHITNLPARGVTDGQVDPKLQKLFECHDTCHVVFGCSTSLIDEGLVDTWTILGSTVTLREYSAYLTHPEVAKIISDALKTHGLLKMMWLYLKGTPYFLRAMVRALRMPSKWPFYDHDQYLDWKVSDVRRHFGIRVLDRADRGI